VIELLSIVATGYLYQSFYKCKEAALELQQLDDNQYNSARVLCIIGKAYYDVGEYESVSFLYFLNNALFSHAYANIRLVYSFVKPFVSLPGIATMLLSIQPRFGTCKMKMN
jgi:hypothetical protein